jgi:NADP-dependent 3-hydroxy acid dehydrogenase YdfG
MADQVLLITGASSGIGAATARRAAEAGYRIALAARRPEPLAALAAELGGPARAIDVPVDVTDWSSQQQMVATTLEAFGAIDAVFANAGMLSAPGWMAEPVEQWREMVLTNVYGAAITVRAALEAITAARGHIVLTSSRAGRYPIAGSLYGATKSAVTAMGEALRMELHSQGVRVTVVHPGWVDTPMLDGAIFPEPPGDILTADDIARAVLYALGQPPRISVNELLVRPTVQPV